MTVKRTANASEIAFMWAVAAVFMSNVKQAERYT
jgi:hypothetical protein